MNCEKKFARNSISCNVHVRLYLLSTGSARTEQNHLPTKILGIQAKHQLVFLQIVVTVKQTLAKFQHDFSKYSIIHCFCLASTFSMKWGNEIRNFSARRFVHFTKRRYVASFILEKKKLFIVKILSQMNTNCKLFL